jgi:HAD superfamily hydrolase (TIGR01458 family)
LISGGLSRQRIRMIRGVLLDLAGVIYEGDHVLPGAVEAVERLHEADLPIRFVTNTTTKTKKALLTRLTKLGLEIADEELFTPGEAALGWLKAHDASPVLLVHPNLEEEFDGTAGRANNAVVVGDAGKAFTYEAMNHAFRALVDGATLLALAKNRTFKGEDGKLSLDAGAFVAALEYAADREAIVLGKPAAGFFEAALSSMTCKADNAVMVGDDAESDIAGALNAGLAHGLLVKTGKYQDGDETRFEPNPAATVDDLPAAVDWILKHRA